MINKIRKELNESSNDEAKKSIRKSIPTAKNIYGVRVPTINRLAEKYKSGGFSLVEKLWNSNRFEEKLLASKILGKICKENPEKTLKLIKKFSNQIECWAVCDTLATQGIKEIAKQKQREIFNLAEKSIKSKDKWKIRFGIVLLTNYAKDRELKNKINKIISKVENDSYYVKKSLSWVKSKIIKI